MPVSPNPIEYPLFFTLNQAPAPTLEIWNAIGLRATLAAIQLGVFDALAYVPLATGTLAERLQVNSAALATLLHTLQAMGYVRLRNGMWQNTNMTRKWVVSSSPTTFAPYFRYWGAILPALWQNLDESIRMGRPPLNLYEWLEQQPEVSRDFQEAMISIANLDAAEIAAKLELLGQSRGVLDVGGGHATYSIALCLRYPDLHAVVFDSARAFATGRRRIDESGLSDRIDAIEGNFLRDELPASCDVILLFNIVHGLTPEQNIALLEKCSRALPDGGTVVALEQLDEKRQSPTLNAVAQLLGLSYMHLLGGRLYRFDEIAGWMQASGFPQVKRMTLVKGGGSALVVGTKARRSVPA